MEACHQALCKAHHLLELAWAGQAAVLLREAYAEKKAGGGAALPAASQARMARRWSKRMKERLSKWADDVSRAPIQ